MKKVALLIGIDEYTDSKITRLKYAANDVISMGEKLQQDCNFDYVRVLTNSEGTKSNIIDELEKLKWKITPDDLFMFFFSGHGIEKNEHAYFLTQESRIKHPQNTGFSYDFLKIVSQEITVKQRIILIDACRNNPRSGKGNADNLMSKFISKDIVTSVTETKNVENMTAAIFTACSEGQRAYEWDEKEHGIFTYYMLEGIGGAAWKGDKLSFGDLVNYTQQKVKEWAKEEKISQIPWYKEIGDCNPMILADKNSVSIKKSSFIKPKIKEKNYKNSKLQSDISFDYDEIIRGIINLNGSKKYLEQVCEGSIDVWQKEAENGNPKAQWLLGRCYEEGLGVEKNLIRAVKLYKKAAEQEFAVAQYELGCCYSIGKGICEDKNESFKWIKAAAEQDYVVAQTILGSCFMDGEGTTINKTKAIKWIKKATDQGYALAESVLGDCFKYGQGVDVDKAEAFKWYKKAANQGFAIA